MGNIFAKSFAKEATKITRKSVRRETPKSRFKRLQRGQKAIEAIGQLPGKGKGIALIVDGNFLGIDILTAVIELEREPCQELHIATLSLNSDNARHIAGMIEAKKILKASLVISESYATRSPEDFKQVEAILTAVGVPITIDRNHTKINLFDYGAKKYVMHGSLNLRRCNAFEQCFIDHCSELYQFFKSFIDDVHARRIKALPPKPKTKPKL